MGHNGQKKDIMFVIQSRKHLRSSRGLKETNKQGANNGRQTGLFEQWIFDGAGSSKF